MVLWADINNQAKCSETAGYFKPSTSGCIGIFSGRELLDIRYSDIGI